MNKHDEIAVESMCKCGMSLETLYTCFPQFSKKEIKNNFERTRGESDNGEDPPQISINCS